MTSWVNLGCCKQGVQFVPSQGVSTHTEGRYQLADTNQWARWRIWCDTSASPGMASLGRKHELVSNLFTAHEKEAANLWRDGCNKGGVTCISRNCGYVSPLPFFCTRTLDWYLLCQLSSEHSFKSDCQSAMASQTFSSWRGTVQFHYPLQCQTAACYHPSFSS